MPDLEFHDVKLAQRGFEVSVCFRGITAIVGPNGAGKSTLLSLVAGGLRPDSGTVSVGDAVVAGPGVFVPAHRRRFAYLEQRALLFPHLSVLGNAAFGLRARGVARAEATQRAEAELAAVGCADLAERRPNALSGGQAQRVALARALAIDPLVVLLDEPLAALDAGVVPQLRRLLRERLMGRTALLVTHDILDVLTLADQVLVLEGGRAVEFGPVDEVCARPQSAFLADLAGVNLLRGRAVADGLEVSGVLVRGMPGEDLRVGEPALATIAPNAVALHRTPPAGSPRNQWAVVVESLEPRGPIVRVRSQLGEQSLSADLTPAAVAELSLVPGDELFAVVKATQVDLYPAGSGPLPSTE